MVITVRGTKRGKLTLDDTSMSLRRMKYMHSEHQEAKCEPRNTYMSNIVQLALL